MRRVFIRSAPRLSAFRQAAACAALLAVAACYPPTLNPDYTVKVVQTSAGPVALPPTCANWQTQNDNPFEEQPQPQFGCATARNLAMSVENPNDLLQGRQMGAASGVTSVGSILRYNANQPRGLIDPSSASSSSASITTAPTPTSSLSGELFTNPSASAASLAPNSSAAGASSGTSAAGGAAP